MTKMEPHRRPCRRPSSTVRPSVRPSVRYAAHSSSVRPHGLTGRGDGSGGRRPSPAPDGLPPEPLTTDMPHPYFPTHHPLAAVRQTTHRTFPPPSFHVRRLKSSISVVCYTCMPRARTGLVYYLRARKSTRHALLSIPNVLAVLFSVLSPYLPNENKLPHNTLYVLIVINQSANYTYIILYIILLRRCRVVYSILSSSIVMFITDIDLAPIIMTYLYKYNIKYILFCI